MCLSLNATTKPVEVDSVTFVRPDGSSVPPTSSTCSYPGLISPGQACRDSLNTGGLIRCVIVTKGNVKSIRASLLLFDTTGSESILEAR